MDINNRHQIWEIFILILSLYVLVEMSIEIISPFNQQLQGTLDLIDFFICCIFLGDFFYFWYKSENKPDYFKKHWIDFVSSIPYVTICRFLRIARIIRFIRLIKFFRGAKGIIPIIKWLTKNKLRNILVSYIFIFVIVWFYCSLAFFALAKGLNPNLHEYSDALWWAFTTATSIGNGKIISITKIGGFISIILTLFGMGLFSLITAELSARFVSIIKNTNNDK